MTSSAGNRRFREMLLALGVAVLALASCATPQSSSDAGATASVPQSSQPNIIYILADDLGYGDIGAYGQTKVRTPHLDLLAERGMLFSQHYSGSTVCAPSRSSLMTGQSTGNTPIRGNAGGVSSGTFLPTGTQTIGSLLKHAGYTTGVVGKWGLGTYADAGAPHLQGIDYFYGYINQRNAHNYYPAFLIENGVKQTLDNGGIKLRPPHVPLEGRTAESIYSDFIGKEYAPDLMQEKVKSFIRKEQDGPFFLYYASVIPHPALQIPNSEIGQYDFAEVGHPGDYYPAHPRPRAARAAMITKLDQQVGEIVALLEELGIAENTLIIFSSDNGGGSSGGGDLDFFNANGGLRGGKRDLTEGGIRVPMIAYWPGMVEPGSKSDHVSAMWDILPTVAELANSPVAQPIDGVSFVPTLMGMGKQRSHEYLYWEFHSRSGGGPAQAVRLGNWKGLRLLKGVAPEDVNDAPIALYNLADDVGETRDVSTAHPRVVETLREIMAGRTPSQVVGWNFELAEDMK